MNKIMVMYIDPRTGLYTPFNPRTKNGKGFNEADPIKDASEVKLKKNKRYEKDKKESVEGELP